MKNDHAIGLLVPGITYSTFAGIIGYIEECIVESGYGLKMGITRNDPALEARFILNMIRQNMNGIIFTRVTDESSFLKISSGNKNLPGAVEAQGQGAVRRLGRRHGRC